MRPARAWSNEVKINVESIEPLFYQPWLMVYPSIIMLFSQGTFNLTRQVKDGTGGFPSQ